MSGWSQSSIAGKPADLFEPTGPNRPRFALLFLHPYGLETLHDRPVYTNLLDKLNLVCVCPHAGRSWWADRVCNDFDPVLTPERFLLEHVVPWMHERWRLAPRALGVFGISMGGQGALRLAFKYPDRFPVAAGIASALDYHERYGQGTPLDAMYDSNEQCRQDTALLWVPPHHPPPHLFFCCDPADLAWYRGNDRLHEKLTALGIEHTADLTSTAGGHSWDYFNYVAEPTLRFLVAGLEKESRRLL